MLNTLQCAISVACLNIVLFVRAKQIRVKGKILKLGNCVETVAVLQDKIKNPACRSVLILARLLDIEFDLRSINVLEKEHLKQEFVSINPQHVIPTIDDHGFILWESRVILTYLCSAFAKDDTLYPKNIRDRALVDQRLQFDLSTLYRRMEDYIQPTMTYGAYLDEKKKLKITEALGWLNTMLNDKKWVATDNMTLADISLCITVNQIQAFGIDISIHSNVNDWMQRCKTELEPHGFENGLEYHDAFSQTGPSDEQISKLDKKLSRDTQTVEVTISGAETLLDHAVQVYGDAKKMIYEHDDNEYEIMPENYESYEEQQSKRDLETKVRLIQRNFRRFLWEKLIKKTAAEWRATRTEQDKRESDRRESYVKKREICCTKKAFPKTKQDFDLLYAEVETWKEKEIARINEQFSGAPKIAELNALLDKEIKLLNAIQRQRFLLRKELENEKNAKLLEKLGKPVTWVTHKNKTIEMDTIRTQRARYLTKFYMEMKKQMNTEERLTLLVNVIPVIFNEQHSQVPGLLELIDREKSMLIRGVDPESLEGLRKRQNVLFMDIIKNEENEKKESKKMSPRLFYAPMSPPSRMVQIVARKIGLDLDLKLVNIDAEELYSSDFLAINPQHCLPTLDDNGLVLWESRAIATYLVSNYSTSDDELYPRDPRKRALVDQMLQFDLGTFYARLNDYYADLLYKNKPLDPEKRTLITEAIEIFDRILSTRKWAAGPMFTLADISLCQSFCQLEAFEFNFQQFIREINQKVIGTSLQVMPKLYYSPTSPPCRSVLLLAKIINVQFDLKTINIFDHEHLKPAFVALNPQHCIPTLCDKNLVLWESRAILTYLVSAYAKDDTLYPKDVRIRALIDQRLHFDLGTLSHRMVEYFYPTIKLGAPLDETKRAKLEEALRWLDSFMKGRTWQATDHFTLADLALCVTVSQIEAFGWNLNAYTKIKPWLKLCKEYLEPHGYDEINEHGSEVLANYFMSRLKH
uniref:glutathione transferase n=2 Tax=Culicoides sonorensis TaxID=179676 RepID=A0A336MUL1_CULSO